MLVFLLPELIFAIWLLIKLRMWPDQAEPLSKMRFWYDCNIKRIHKGFRTQNSSSLQFFVTKLWLHDKTIIYSSPIEYILRKMAKQDFVYHCWQWLAVTWKWLLHMLWISHHYETFTECRNEDSVAEIDTNSIFKIFCDLTTFLH